MANLLLCSSKHVGDPEADFTLVIDGVGHGCQSDIDAFFPSEAMTQEEFQELWPALMLLLVLGFCGWAVRKMLM